MSSLHDEFQRAERLLRRAVEAEEKLTKVGALADEWERIGEKGLPHLGCLDMYRHLAGELREALEGD